MNKSELRRILKEKRGSIEKDERIRKSEMICKKITDSCIFRDAEIVMIYLSFLNEVDTKKIIRVAFREGKKVLVPVVDADTMYSCELKSFDRLTKGTFGINEPAEKEQWKGNIDLCIIPGLGFDRKGGRIGFGRGYYDKFLSKNQCMKVGLAFSEQIEEDVFCEEYDIPMDIIVTEEEMFYCGD